VHPTAPARDGGRRASRLEEVPATSAAVLALAARLLADRVELVVMEATSDYWRIWYYLLESAGLNVQLVNSRHARQLAGRPKTDPLTELSDVSAAQVGRPSRWSITEMPGRSGLPGCCSPCCQPDHHRNRTYEA
jgi:transposase